MKAAGLCGLRIDKCSSGCGWMPRQLHESCRGHTCPGKPRLEPSHGDNTHHSHSPPPFVRVCGCAFTSTGFQLLPESVIETLESDNNHMWERVLVTVVRLRNESLGGGTVMVSLSPSVQSLWPFLSESTARNGNSAASNFSRVQFSAL